MLTRKGRRASIGIKPRWRLRAPDHESGRADSPTWEEEDLPTCSGKDTSPPAVEDFVSPSEKGPRPSAYGLLKESSLDSGMRVIESVTTCDDLVPYSGVGHKRRSSAPISVAIEKAKVRKGALDERERIELEMIDLLHAAESEHSVNARDWRDPPLVRPRSEVYVQGEQNVGVAPGYLALCEPRGADRGSPFSNLSVYEPRGTDESRSAEFLVKRLTTSKDLPSFSGDCVNRLRFKQSFELSTELGQYTDKENVARLHESLTGEAKAAVAALLITSCDSKQIMRVLELRFGNPEEILDRLSADIFALPGMSMGRVDLAQFATTVNNCVAAIQAIGNAGYLHSPHIVRDIIDKLPATMVFDYSRHLDSVPPDQPRLVTIARYLLNKAERACRAGTVRAGGSGVSSTANARSINAIASNARLQKATFLCVSTTSNDDRGPTRCTFCEITGHVTARCRKLAGLEVDKRWEWARDRKMCFKCLNGKHRKFSCRAEMCPVRDCGKPHHSLLHMDQRAAIKPSIVTDRREYVANSTVGESPM